MSITSSFYLIIILCLWLLLDLEIVIESSIRFSLIFVGIGFLVMMAPSLLIVRLVVLIEHIQDFFSCTNGIGFACWLSSASIIGSGSVGPS